MSIVIDYTKGFFEASPAGETVGDISGNATLDLSSGNVFSHTPTANTTFVFSNPPASGTAYEFTLKISNAEVTDGYDLGNASYDSVDLSVSAQDSSPVGLAFKPDGTKMYISGNTNDSIYQYTLSTAWDLSTGSYDSVSFSVASQATNPRGLSFKPDGTKMYLVGVNSDEVYQYSLSTAWDLSTASYDSVSIDVNSEDTLPRGLSFKPDGTKMYVSGTSTDTIYQYGLSTAWDLSTASYDSVSFSVSSEESNPYAIQFKSDGTEMLMLGASGKDVYQYSLSTAWDLSTASYDNVSFNVSSQAFSPQSLFFKSDGSKFYVSVGLSSYNVLQYSSSSTLTPSFTYPASVQWPSGIAPTDTADGQTDLLRFLTTDGGSTYFGRLLGDNFS